MITQKRLKELFSYNEKTGEFTRIAPVKKARVGDIAGTIAKNGYITISVDCKRYYAHRLAFLFVHGYLPEQIDHINMIRNDNRIENLRAANHQLNEANKVSKNTETSPYRGVSLRKETGKWNSRIKVNKKEIFLGSYNDPKDAARAYNEAAKEHFGDYARLNNV